MINELCVVMCYVFIAHVTFTGSSAGYKLWQQQEGPVVPLLHTLGPVDLRPCGPVALWGPSSWPVVVLDLKTGELWETEFSSESFLNPQWKTSAVDLNATVMNSSVWSVQTIMWLKL